MTAARAHARRAFRVYDMNVQSDIFFPELQTLSDNAATDIIIRRGLNRQPEVSDPGNIRTYLDGSTGYLWLNIPEILSMEITDGRSIAYERAPGIEDDEVRLFLLGSGLGAILMQRGHVVIHGNAIVTEKQDGAIMCIGDTGAGKSTTAIAMMQRGLRVLADDVCPLDAQGFVLPGMARAKLWEETARQLGIDTSGLSRIRSTDAKFNLPLGSAHCATPQSVRAFYWLVPDDVADVSIRSVDGAEKFTVLRNNVYRPEYLRPLGLEVDYLRRLALIASNTPVFQILRPKKGFEIDSLLDTILSNDHQQRENA
ncbi:MAG: hypothetical protein WAT93_02380 [Pontixanthobacter sp.]